MLVTFHVFNAYESMVVVGVTNNWPRTEVKRWQGSQRRIKRYEKERIREEKKCDLR